MNTHFASRLNFVQGILLILIFWNLRNFGYTSCYIIARGIFWNSYHFGWTLISVSYFLQYNGTKVWTLMPTSVTHRNTCRISNASQQHKSNCVVAHWELWGYTLLSLLFITNDFAYQSSIGYSPCRIKLDLCVLALRSLFIWRMNKDHY